MLSTNTISKIIECAQSRGADFSEVFVEESLSSSINLLDKKIDEKIAAELFSDCIVSDEGREGFNSFFEKRIPSWVPEQNKTNNTKE